MNRLSIAGLEIGVKGAPIADCLASFEHYPSAGGELEAIVEVEVTPGFLDRPKTPNFPAFAHSAPEPGLNQFSRQDIEGTVDSRGPVVRGHFQVSDYKGSLESAIRLTSSIALVRVDALIFHASASLSPAGEAHMFLAVSGTGKSTIAELLTTRGATRISDELVIAKRTRSGPRAFVCPFAGKVDLPYGKSYPLAAMHFLAQAAKHEVVPIGVAEALPQLLRHAVAFARQPEEAERLMSLALEFLDEVPASELRFAKRSDVFDAIFIT